MFYAQSSAKGHISGRNKTATIFIHYLIHIPPLRIGEIQIGNLKLNEPGRQNLSRQQPCKQAQHAKLYSDITQARKREHVIALDSQQGEGGRCLNARYPTAGGRVRFEHPRLAEVVPNCLVSFYDMRCAVNHRGQAHDTLLPHTRRDSMMATTRDGLTPPVNE